MPRNSYGAALIGPHYAKDVEIETSVPSPCGCKKALTRLSTRPEINVFLASITGALLRWLVLAVLALRRARRLAPHPVLFAKIHIYFCPSTWARERRRGGKKP
jgi:hypothetical protein